MIGAPWEGPGILRQSQAGSATAESRAAGMAASLQGLPSLARAIEDLEASADLLRAGWLPVGSVEFVREAMRVAGIEEPANMTYPDALREFLGREVRIVLAGEARAREGFVKPTRAKVFTGFVHNPGVAADELGEHEAEQRSALMAMDPSEPVWISERASFQGEWRAYVVKKTVVGFERYDPDGPDEAPEPPRAWLEKLIGAWSASGTMPAACALDVGVLEDGSFALVEANDGWALGLYGRGVDPKDYLAFLGARWDELRSAPKPGSKPARGPK